MPKHKRPNRDPQTGAALPEPPIVTPEETIQKAVDEAKKTRKPRSLAAKAKAVLGLA